MTEGREDKSTDARSLDFAGECSNVGDSSSDDLSWEPKELLLSECREAVLSVRDEVRGEACGDGEGDDERSLGDELRVGDCPRINGLRLRLVEELSSVKSSLMRRFGLSENLRGLGSLGSTDGSRLKGDFSCDESKMALSCCLSSFA